MDDHVFANKVCVVTGAASGLGLEFSKQLAAAGAQVVMADIDEARLRTVEAQIRAAGGTVSLRPTDVTQPEAVQALIETAVAEFDRIDYLFNNAGVAGAGEIRDVTLDHWRRTLGVNLFGVIHGVHFALPVMIRQGRFAPFAYRSITRRTIRDFRKKIRRAPLPELSLSEPAKGPPP